MTGKTRQLLRHTSPWLKGGLIALAAFTCMLTTAQEIPGWELVWQDEFNGTSIDTTKWSHEVNGDGGGNNELQYYTARSQNSFIENGNLVIQALEENYGGRNYTSARLRTLNKGDWTYGRFEARMKLPYGQGIWPAFWMLPTDWVYGGWAASGEIDIMEIVGHEPDLLHGTIHYGGEWPNNTYSGGEINLSGSMDLSEEFHVYAIEWQEGEIRWYIDDIHYSTKNVWHSDAGPYPAPFNQRFHFLLNVAVGGQWPGSPDGSTVFPQRMEVDYVRVYSTTNTPPPPPPSTPYSGTPMAIPGTIEVEDYDNGGPGVAYIDADGGNSGNSYRSDGVDIEACTDAGGGYNVGWTATGEWLKYTVDIASAGDYTITTRVASQNGGGAFRIEVDDVDVTGSIPVGATGGWQGWVDKTSSVTLGSGEQVVKLVVESGGMNINRMEFVLDQAVNTPPFFTSIPAVKANATEDAAYTGQTIAGNATDADSDPMSFSLVPGGPGWLSVATNGTLSGLPDNADVGLNSWTVQVTDGINSPVTATLEITVDNVNDAPIFSADPIIMPNGLEGSGYIRTIAGSATDVDAGDALTYSKVSGPTWLNVATNGLLSGLPAIADVGLKSWTVQASDGNGGTDTATLQITVDGLEVAPTLSIQVSGSNLEILWPSSTTAYSLYGSTNLMPPVVWSSVTNAPIIQGDDWMVVMPLVGAPQFFRLENP